MQVCVILWAAGAVWKAGNWMPYLALPREAPVHGGSQSILLANRLAVRDHTPEVVLVVGKNRSHNLYWVFKILFAFGITPHKNHCRLYLVLVFRQHKF